MGIGLSEAGEARLVACVVAPPVVGGGSGISVQVEAGVALGGTGSVASEAGNVASTIEDDKLADSPFVSGVGLIAADSPAHR